MSTHRRELIDLVSRLQKFEPKTRILFAKDGTIGGIEAFDRYYSDLNMNTFIGFAETARRILAKRERETI